METFVKKRPLRATRRPLKFKEWVKIPGISFLVSFLLTTLFEAIRRIYKQYNETYTTGDTMKIIEKIANVRSNRQFKKQVEAGLANLDEFFTELNSK